MFEYILNPDRVFREIARNIKPSGAHIFTVPRYYWRKTFERTREVEGQIEHLCQPEYHDSQISEGGSLVIREWGRDMRDFIPLYSGMPTVAIHTCDPHKGIEAQPMEVFISRKAG